MRKKIKGPIGHAGSYGGHHADGKRHKSHEHTGHGSKPGHHRGGHKAKHHGPATSDGRKPRKRSNKENARVTRPLLGEQIEKRLKDVPL